MLASVSVFLFVAVLWTVYPCFTFIWQFGAIWHRGTDLPGYSKAVNPVVHGQFLNRYFKELREGPKLNFVHFFSQGHPQQKGLREKEGGTEATQILMIGSSLNINVFLGRK